jgi:hypothetical protein
MYYKVTKTPGYGTATAMPCQGTGSCEHGNARCRRINNAWRRRSSARARERSDNWDIGTNASTGGRPTRNTGTPAAGCPKNFCNASFHVACFSWRASAARPSRARSGSERGPYVATTLRPREQSMDGAHGLQVFVEPFVARHHYRKAVHVLHEFSSWRNCFRLQIRGIYACSSPPGC